MASVVNSKYVSEVAPRARSTASKCSISARSSATAPAMRARYPELRFAYEWQFLNGQLGDGSVYADGP